MIILKVFVSFLRTGFISANLKRWKNWTFIELLKSECIKSVKISALILTVSVGISVSWLAFDEFRLHVSSKIYFLSMSEIEKEGFFVLPVSSPSASILGWFLYFAIDLILGSLILSEIGHS